MQRRWFLGAAVASCLAAPSMAFVTFIPTGFYQSQQAWRSELEGVVSAPFPVFWGVSRA